MQDFTELINTVISIYKKNMILNSNISVILNEQNNIIITYGKNTDKFKINDVEYFIKKLNDFGTRLLNDQDMYVMIKMNNKVKNGYLITISQTHCGYTYFGL